MRGGKIHVRRNARYRTGIHMKAYREKLPLLLIGGSTGSFLSERQAGGIIIVLGLDTDGKSLISNFSCTGMHGGKLFLRSDCAGIAFPEQVTARPATPEDMTEIEPYLREFCALFDAPFDKAFAPPYTVVTLDSRNPYQRMYVANRGAAIRTANARIVGAIRAR